MSRHSQWLTIRRGQAPLILSFPHTGTDIPASCEAGFVSLWRARRDADWWIDKLYDFATDFDATIVHTAISRSIIDVNRDPSGISLYPGLATTELCPTTTFDGEPLYKDKVPDSREIDARREAYFDPYHAAITEEIARLRSLHPKISLYDCHSIRSEIPRLFDGKLPIFNIGTNSGASCDPAMVRRVGTLCAAASLSHVVNGRFRGGYITRHHGAPGRGVHAIQMELACRAYMHEPEAYPSEANWPTPYDAAYAAPVRAILKDIVIACLQFAQEA